MLLNVPDEVCVCVLCVCSMCACVFMCVHVYVEDRSQSTMSFHRHDLPSLSFSLPLFFPPSLPISCLFVSDKGPRWPETLHISQVDLPSSPKALFVSGFLELELSVHASPPDFLSLGCVQAN